MLLEKLAEKENLEIRNNKILVHPVSQFNFRRAELDDPDAVELSLEDFLGIRNQIYQFNSDLNGIEDYSGSSYNAFLEANAEKLRKNFSVQKIRAQIEAKIRQLKERENRENEQQNNQ